MRTFENFINKGDNNGSYKGVIKAGFSYDNIASLQIDDADRVGAAVLVHVVSIDDLQSDDVRRN